MVKDTGHLATVALSSSSFNGSVVDIQEPTFSLPDVPSSDLATTDFEEYEPGDLSEPGQVTVTAQFDSGSAIPTRGTVETMTITRPTASGQTTPASLVGTGYIKEVGLPQLVKNSLMIITYVFKFDGKTGPTHTAAS